MSKNYYKIDVLGGDGYSFMVCTSETNEDAVIELAKECFSDPSDMDRASIDPLIDEDDIEHFKSCGCLYDLDGDDDPVPAEQKECQESVATIELKKVDPCDNDLLLSILEVLELISQAPLSSSQPHEITIEKLLVDIIADKSIEATYSPAELPEIIRNIRENYRVDVKKMNRYAGRRGKAKIIEEYMRGKIKDAI